MRHQFILAAAAAILTACDDGRIYPDETVIASTGRTVRIECRLTGAEAWTLTPDYSLSLAAFADGSGYALVSRNIDIRGEADSVLTLTGVPAEAATVEICVLDRLRKRVVTLASAEADNDFTAMPALDASPLAAVQRAVFTPTCSACHGGGHNAGGLSLASATETRASTVGVTARHATEGAEKRVEPGCPDASVLYRALTAGVSESWAYDHSVEVVDPTLRDLVALWIKSEKPSE